MTISTHAEECHHARTVTPNFAGEAGPPGDEFRRRELIGARCRPADQVGKAVTQARKGLLLRGMKQAGREPGAMQRGPEAVAGTGEVVAGRGGVQAGIDAAEEDGKAGRDDIAQLLAARSLELCRARPAGRAARRA